MMAPVPAPTPVAIRVERPRWVSSGNSLGRTPQPIVATPSRQLVPHRRRVRCPAPPDGCAPTNTPIEDYEPYVDRSGGLPACLLDQGTGLDQQFSGLGSSDPNQFVSSLPFYYVHPITVTPWDIGSSGCNGLGGEPSGYFVRRSSRQLCNRLLHNCRGNGLLPPRVQPYAPPGKSL